MSNYHVVYLTGAPAAGKSTIARRLSSQVDIAVWDYGQELLNRVVARLNVSYPELRARSAELITSADVSRTDDELIAWAHEQRKAKHVLIDTHAVTRESFGFRVTPFSCEQILRLAPTLLVSLFVAPNVAVQRIATAPEGRLPVTEFEAAFHAALQSCVVVNYATSLGTAAYIVDASAPPEDTVSWLLARLGGA